MEVVGWNLVWRGISAFSASAVLMGASTAARLIIGRTPGMPRQISQTWVFGGSFTSATLHPQNIFDRVFGWTCTSMPITTSQSLGNVSDLSPHLARLFVRASDAEHDVLAPFPAHPLHPHARAPRSPARTPNPH